MYRRAVALVIASVLAAPSSAQQPDDTLAIGVPPSAVVVLDRDILFGGSLFGQRIAQDIDAAAAELAAENRKIEADLEAEERTLTDRRDTLSMEEFGVLAAEFDSRVTAIRLTQDAKSRAITQRTDRAQQIFLEQVNPVLVVLARETGALVILDRRFVIASADQVNITDLAVARIDAALGDGRGLLDSTPEPRPDQTVPPTGD